MWWINKFGSISGPYSDEQIRKLVQTNRLTRLHKVSQDKMAWTQLDQTIFWKRTLSRPAEMEPPETAATVLKMNHGAKVSDECLTNATIEPDGEAEVDYGIDGGVSMPKRKAVDKSNVESNGMENVSSRPRRVFCASTKAVESNGASCRGSQAVHGLQVVWGVVSIVFLIISVIYLLPGFVNILRQTTGTDFGLGNVIYDDSDCLIEISNELQEKNYEKAMEWANKMRDDRLRRGAINDIKSVKELNQSIDSISTSW